MILDTELPECKLDNLEQISDLVTNVQPTQRSALAAQMTENVNTVMLLPTHICVDCLPTARMIQDGAYLNTLLELFSDCEDLEDDAHLPLLAKIVRHVLFLNDNTLLQIVLEEDTYLKVAGCLECKHFFSSTRSMYA